MSDNRIVFPALILATALLLHSRHGAAEVAAPNAASGQQFIGPAGCSSSSCHGGGAKNHDQYLVWSKQDYHARAYATLTSSRAARLSEALQIAEPTKDVRCTSCHAPFHEIPAAHRAPAATPQLGVSCESCHGPAGPWLRPHTRLDYSHAERVSAGLRDLRDPYVRANTCVACHQTLDSAVRHAGHPELLFELDGQCVTQPRHWRMPDVAPSPALWLVGQAVALREMTWQLSQQESPAPEDLERAQALLWLLQRVASQFPALPALATLGLSDHPALKKCQAAADEFARQAATLKWSEDAVARLIAYLAGIIDDFAAKPIPTVLHARRAERLVVALDRLLMAMPDAQAAAAKTEMDHLFAAVQSLPDFNPSEFVRRLGRFALRLKTPPSIE